MRRSEKEKACRRREMNVDDEWRYNKNNGKIIESKCSWCHIRRCANGVQYFKAYYRYHYKNCDHHHSFISFHSSFLWTNNILSKELKLVNRVFFVNRLLHSNSTWSKELQFLNLWINALVFHCWSWKLHIWPHIVLDAFQLNVLTQEYFKFLIGWTWIDYWFTWLYSIFWYSKVVKHCWLDYKHCKNIDGMLASWRVFLFVQ